VNQYIGYRRVKNFTEVVGLRSEPNIFIGDGPINDPASFSANVSGIGR
jgi:hypothetical protein